MSLYFENVTGTNFQLVPYLGGAPMNQDLLAGRLDFTLGMAASTYQFVRSGQLKAYAVMAKSRWWAAPDVPTMEEAGVPGLYALFWHGLWAPKGTARAVVARLNSAVQSALANAAVQNATPTRAKRSHQPTNGPQRRSAHCKKLK